METNSLLHRRSISEFSSPTGHPYIADGLQMLFMGTTPPESGKWPGMLGDQAYVSLYSSILYDVANKKYYCNINKGDAYGTIVSPNYDSFQDNAITVELVGSFPAQTATARPFSMRVGTATTFLDILETGSNNGRFDFQLSATSSPLNNQLPITPPGKSLTCVVNNGQFSVYSREGDNSLSIARASSVAAYPSNYEKSDWCIFGVPSNPRSIKGDIYCVRVYNRALSEAEINANYLKDRQTFNI